MLVDRNTRHRNKEVDFEEKRMYGQLQRVVPVRIEVSSTLVPETRTFLLAVVKPCKTEARIVGDATCTMTQTYTKGGFLAEDVIDIGALERVAARVVDRGVQVFVERAGSFDWLGLGYDEGEGEDQ